MQVDESPPPLIYRATVVSDDSNFDLYVQAVRTESR